jgi:LemA protein
MEGEMKVSGVRGPLKFYPGRGLLAVAEAYPDLKANENFIELQGELSSLEDAIQNSRRYYNAVVRDLNTACDVFPSNLVAQGFGITKKDYFELEDAGERTAPQVSFGE